MIAAWLALLAALVAHRQPPREEPPAWYDEICAEVRVC